MNPNHDKIKYVDGLYELWKYEDDTGRFEYEEYQKVQIRANKEKINHVWVQKENIEFISKYILDKHGQPRFGLCHGTRRGYEQKWFRDNLGCEVIGTEISDTAQQYQNTIQWDFHDAKQEWIGNTDFIYSNSFDHSYDPNKCLNNWMGCLSDKGICILEHTQGHYKSAQVDPVGIRLEIFPFLILKWSKGKYFASDILDAPVQSKFKDKAYNTYFIIIENKK